MPPQGEVASILLCWAQASYRPSQTRKHPKALKPYLPSPQQPPDEILGTLREDKNSMAVPLPPPPSEAFTMIGKPTWSLGKSGIFRAQGSHS